MKGLSRGYKYRTKAGYKKVRPQKRPKNSAEAKFWDYADSKDWIISKRGWPDFFCFLPDGRFVLVEVKSKTRPNLGTWQLAVMRALSAKGITCYRWTEETGFIKINKDGGDINE